MPTKTSNTKRAEQAVRGLIANTGDPHEVRADTKSAMVDLLTNLMHLCGRKGVAIDLDDCLRIARNHFGSEAKVDVSDRSDLKLSELGSIYVSPEDRFIVSFIIGFNGENGVESVQEAVAAAIHHITKDENCGDTRWFCFDREHNRMHNVEQSDAVP